MLVVLVVFFVVPAVYLSVAPNDNIAVLVSLVPTVGVCLCIVLAVAWLLFCCAFPSKHKND